MDGSRSSRLAARLILFFLFFSFFFSSVRFIILGTVEQHRSVSDLFFSFSFSFSRKERYRVGHRMRVSVNFIPKKRRAHMLVF